MISLNGYLVTVTDAEFNQHKIIADKEPELAQLVSLIGQSRMYFLDRVEALGPVQRGSDAIQYLAEQNKPEGLDFG